MARSSSAGGGRAAREEAVPRVRVHRPYNTGEQIQFELPRDPLFILFRLKSVNFVIFCRKLIIKLGLFRAREFFQEFVHNILLFKIIINFLNV